MKKCARESQSRSYVMNSEEVFKIATNIQRRMMPLFIYTTDEKQYNQKEHWTSHANKVKANLLFKDDCDGYAATAAELLIEQGISRNNIKLIYCTTETGEAHLVCGVSSDTDTYIIENRYHAVYEWRSKFGYKWLFFMALDKPGEWNKIINA